ncbi:hypothetical protein BN1708_003025 [Verticillium longisporum]|uniref:Uncharacterized protein n=1 Tax=Verticillium longisporum TaxID=100787 RepID=A0A0G4L6Y0_VERLO|nr:hypothetical protein BN1708_003025 [Verticillium longisporum]
MVGLEHCTTSELGVGRNDNTLCLMQHHVRSFRSAKKTMNLLSRSSMSALAGLRSSTVGWQPECHVDNIQICRSSNNTDSFLMAASQAWQSTPCSSMMFERQKESKREAGARSRT